MVRTTDWGSTKVNTPTSSHCVKYRDDGMAPPAKGSSISGEVSLMEVMMAS